MRYDLAVIGSGGGAFAAAIATRNKGRSVIMIERGTIGGTCVNTGCVPSKALLAAAEARHVALDHRFPGIHWEILHGTARFVPGPALEVKLADGGSTTVEAEHYLIATGSTPWAPPVDGHADAGYLTSTTAMELDTLPASMIVLGGNAVGLEQAQLWARLGVQVTVVEALPRLAPFEEPELSEILTDAFHEEGITVVTGATTTRLHRDAAGYRLTLTNAGLRANRLLVATGRRPVTGGLNLNTVGVTIGDRGEVVVDEHLRTGNPRIWAAGDVTGHPQFVYVAGAHGTLVADNAFDGIDGRAGHTLDYHHLPRVTFTSPAIASAGLTEAQADAAGIACDCRVLTLDNVPRALVNRDTRGAIKLVAEQSTGRLLGAHVIADGAGEVIAAAVYALANRMTVRQLADTWLPYLTMAEGLKLAAQTYTRDVAKLSCCAS